MQLVRLEVISQILITYLLTPWSPLRQIPIPLHYLSVASITSVSALVIILCIFQRYRSGPSYFSSIL
jgi:hypothetical protein